MTRIVQGLLALAITVAVAGAVATAADRQAGPEDDQAVDNTDVVLQSEAIETVTASTLEVPIRSGLLADDVSPETVRPVSVRVVGIGLEAEILPVGVDAQNQFAVPAAHTVGWYEYSSSPGDPGASVLAAHVDYGGEPGAFFNLEEVLPGDTLEVELEDGTVIAYRVTGNTQYDKTDLPSDELFRKDGPSVLQLITCGGTFNPEERSYEANVVVTAVPITG